MDPDATLKEIRELVAGMLEHWDDETYPAADDVFRLAELVEVLDLWLSGGGCLPGAWKRFD